MPSGNGPPFATRRPRKGQLFWLLVLQACLGTFVAFAQEQPSERTTLAPPPASIALLENSARVQIDRAESLLKNGSAEEALEAFRRVIDQHGDRLLEWPVSEGEVPSSFTRYGLVRERAWMRLATLHHVSPELLASFRRQIDAQARRWFERSQPYDEALDRRIVEELFLSSFGDNALLRLGDFALERGDYNVARRYWERIAPGLRFVPNRHDQLKNAANRPLWLPFIGSDVAQVWPQVAPLFSADSAPTELVYPDTDLMVATIRARLATASIMERNFERARIEIAILKQLFPDARGTVAGVEGSLVELTQDLLADANKWPTASKSNEWTTFAGTSARNRVSDPIDELSEKPLWSVKLPNWTTENEALTYNRVRVAEDSRALLPYFPLIVQDLAIVQTQPTRNQVQAFRLRTGEPALPAAGRALGAIESSDDRSTLGVPRFAPTSLGMTVFLLEGTSEVVDLRRTSAPIGEVGGDRSRCGTKAVVGIRTTSSRVACWDRVGRTASFRWVALIHLSEIARSGSRRNARGGLGPSRWSAAVEAVYRGGRTGC